MSEFDALRAELRQARAHLKRATETTARHDEAVKRLIAERIALQRRANPEDPADRREAAELTARLRRAEEALQASRATARGLDASAADLSKRFATFTDPREGV